METWDAIRARRNVRSYRPDPIPDADLERIAEAGWRAPSASNRQHWDFVLVTDREQLKELSTVWRGAGHIAGLAAADLGIGTGHSSVGDQEAARAILGVPADHDVAYLIGAGYPADRPLRPIAKPNRRPFKEVLHRGHW
jgi:nitroreductase